MVFSLTNFNKRAIYGKNLLLTIRQENKMCPINSQENKKVIAACDELEIVLAEWRPLSFAVPRKLMMIDRAVQLSLVIVSRCSDIHFLNQWIEERVMPKPVRDLWKQRLNSLLEEEANREAPLCSDIGTVIRRLGQCEMYSKAYVVWSHRYVSLIRTKIIACDEICDAKQEYDYWKDNNNMFASLWYLRWVELSESQAIKDWYVYKYRCC